jgi:predicted enzyme related to lactoylglutathione lyase
MEYRASLMTIMVADMDRAVSFYTDTLGLSLRFRAGNDWAEVNSPGVRIGLHPTRAGSSPSASQSVSLGFEVNDIDTAMSELKGRNVAFAGGIIDGGQERIAHFSDPDGHLLYLFQQVGRGG